MVSGKRYIVPVARLVYAAFVGKDFNDPNLEDARTGDNGIEDCSIENIVVYTGE